MKSRHKLNRMELREERTAYGFLFLSLIGTTVFILVPILMSMFLGFTAWNPMKGLAGVEFTGLENFQNILKDDRVLSAIRNNLIYSFSYVPLTISIALVMASLLNKFVFCKIPIRMMTFMPYISSLVSVATVWMVLLYPDKGPVNSIFNPK